MRIKKIRLSNGYKRFHDLTIDLGDNPARIVALVGPNGCGKSSVLDGLLFRHRAHRVIGKQTLHDSLYHSQNKDKLVEFKDIEVVFTEGDFRSMLQSREAVGKPGTLISFRSPYRFNNYIKISEIKAMNPIQDNNYGADFASSLDSKMEDNYRRLQGLVTEYEQTHDVKPSEARAKVIGDLNDSISRCVDLTISNVGNVAQNKGTLYFSKPDHPNEFEFNVLSSGEKKVIDILVDLYLRKNDYDDSIFLIDEPELHINTSIQGKLLREIDKLIGEKCQIWLTTHSIGFLRTLQTEMGSKSQIIQFKSDYELASKPYTLTPMKVSAAAWRELFSVALDDLTTLICPTTIIYCEGRDMPGPGGAERGLDAKVYNNIFASSKPNALFISSGGNTELDQRSAVAIALLGKIFPAVKILVFKDRDMASGKPTTEADRQLYLANNPQNHRVMKRLEIENYLFDKEVLASYCASNNLTFNVAAYDTFVTDIVNQNLKDEINRIKNFCGIKANISSDIFKITLSNYVSESMNVYKELEDCIFNRK